LQGFAIVTNQFPAFTATAAGENWRQFFADTSSCSLPSWLTGDRFGF